MNGASHLWKGIPPLSPLRHRLENSTLLARLLAMIVGGYLRLCQRTTRWQVQGLDELKADLADGPVLWIMWHERSMMGPVHWPVGAGQLSSLAADSAIGRISSAMQRGFGLQPMAMGEHRSNVAASREVLRRVRAGVSIGMTGDGPRGPALLVKNAPLDWARAMQRPVWVYAFATTRGRHLKSWDRMWLPYPFGCGAVVFSRCDLDLPRKADVDAVEMGRGRMAKALTDAGQRAGDLLVEN